MEIRRAWHIIAYAVALLVGAFENAHAAKLIQGEVKYAFRVRGPSHVIACGSAFWTYSTAEESLYQVDLLTGAQKTRTPAFTKHAGERAALTALGCHGNEAVYAIEREDSRGKKSWELYRLATLDGVWTSFPLKAPTTGTIQDIHCGKGVCYLLQGKRLYRSGGLTNWQEVSIPPAEQIPSVTPTEDEAPGDNPFRNWQERFTIAQNAYLRVMPGASGEPVILDSGRSQLISLGKSPGRFGNWGVWEGRLMRARGFTLISGRDQKPFWAVSDVALKRVFLFSPSGQYVGTLGTERDPLLFQYPLDITAGAGLVIIADYRANSIVAVAPAAAEDGKFRIAELEDDIGRMNLFRNPLSIDRYDEDRCLSCHDGTQVQSLGVFAVGQHHPIRPKLKEGQEPVRCSTCHSAHHEKGKITPVGSALCIECHKEKNNSERNHFRLTEGANSKVKGLKASLKGARGKAFEVSNCVQCHTMHMGEEHLLRTTSTALCMNCHDSSQKPMNHVFGELPAIRTFEMAEDDRKPIQCLSCHQLHGGNEDYSFAKAVNGNATCLSCHRDLKPEPGVETHLTKVRKQMIEKKKKDHPWRPEEQVCIECHNPHEKLPTRAELCSSCHTDRKQLHTQIITVADTSRAEGIRLKNEQITCITCHSVHGKEPTPTKLLNFCAACHAKDAEILNKEFHKRFSKGRSK